MAAPIIGDLANVREPAGIPGFVISLNGLLAGFGLRVLADAEIRLANVPRKAQHDGFRRARCQSERHEQRPPRRGAALGDGRVIVAFAVGNFLPRDRERIKPAAAKPGVIHLHRRIVHRGGERAFLPTPFLWPGAPEHESAGRDLHGIRILPTTMKFFALHENTASRGLALLFVKRYSSAATGRLELSASPGSNGLQ